MAITQALCTSFKLDLLKGTHDLENDLFMIALYGADANINANTTEYVTAGEVTGEGYPAGGMPLTVVPPVIMNGVAVCGFEQVVFLGADVVTRGALIYNASKDNKAVMVLNFGYDRHSFSGQLSISFPALSADNAILRVM